MRSKTSAALLLLAIFLLGGVAGGGSFYIYRTHVFPVPPQGPRLAGRHDIVEEMAQGLKLDQQQKEQLKGIWQQSRDRYNALSLEFRPQYEKIRAETNEAIRAILRPEQRQQFDDTLKKMDSRHSSHTHEASPPGPGIPAK
jgi:Spy/CpxP family protein refolding chaperone